MPQSLVSEIVLPGHNFSFIERNMLLILILSGSDINLQGLSHIASIMLMKQNGLSAKKSVAISTWPYYLSELHIFVQQGRYAIMICI